MAYGKDLLFLLSEGIGIENSFNNEFIIFGAIIGLFLIFSLSFRFINLKIIHRFIKYTDTDLDDIILKVIKKPILLLIIILGFYLGFQELSILEKSLFYINGVLFTFSILIVSNIIIKLSNFFISRIIIRDDVKKTPKLINRIISSIILLLAALIIFNYLGFDVTVIFAALGVGGIAIGFALKETLSNFFSGVNIVSDRQINVDDYVELPEKNIQGYVEDIGWRSTKIKPFGGNTIIIPNSKLAENIITNKTSKNKETGIIIECGVSYESDLENVEKITLKIAKQIQKNTQGALKDFNPLFRYKKFGDSNIEFYVVLRVERFIERYNVKHQFIKKLKSEFDKEGIEIAWPIRKVYNVNIEE